MPGQIATPELPVASSGELALPRHPASFRDPSGFIFRGRRGELLRQVNRTYEPQFALLEQSGLFEELWKQGWLIGHEEMPLESKASDAASRVLRPEPLPFISYPYEWAFSALRDAALLTLRIERAALARGMSLKDASAYNVQFRGARPIFVDTLSFEPYAEGTPWTAYGQFCRHFLAPLALMSYVDVGLGRLLALHLDGVPLDLAARLLPWTSWFNLGLASHLHLHAGMVRSYGNTADTDGTPSSDTTHPTAQMSRGQREAILDHLEATLESLTYAAAGTEWADYYKTHSYSSDDFDRKQQIVGEWLAELSPTCVWDLGANTGFFSRLASRQGAFTLALDIDPACVERNYLAAREAGDACLLPLCCDLTNPSPDLGWAGRERDGLPARGPCDVALALALAHHLAIANNVPLPLLAETLAELCGTLIVEWVPKHDPQTRRLLRSRPDIFPDYHQPGFEEAFTRRFEIVRRQPLGSDGRTLYLVRTKLR